MGCLWPGLARPRDQSDAEGPPCLAAPPSLQQIERGAQVAALARCSGAARPGPALPARRSDRAQTVLSLGAVLRVRALRLEAAALQSARGSRCSLPAPSNAGATTTARLRRPLPKSALARRRP